MPINLVGSQGVDAPGFTEAGVPVVESGSNSDGERTRWSDGTQQCWGARAGDIAISNQVTGVYRTDAIQGMFSLPFLSGGDVRVSVQAKYVFGGLSSGWVGLVEAFDSLSYRFRVFAVSSDTVVSAHYSAIGRWK